MSAAEKLESPTTALATICAPLEAQKATLVRDAFASMFAQVESWQEEAAKLVVTAEDQTAKMKRARLLRLEVREVRVKLDKKRKAMKEGILLEGRAIDGAFNIFESLTKPIETHLLEQEQFAERAEAARKDALRSARTSALLALDVTPSAISPALGEMSEDAWASVLEDAKAAREARLEQARLDEAARVEAARIIAEQDAARKAAAAKAEAERRAREEATRVENERLRKEAAAREAEIAAEREKARVEQAARHAEMVAKREEDERRHAEERRMAEAARLKAEGEARAAREALAKAEESRRQPEAAKIVDDPKKPTKAKYASMIAALTEIARWGKDLDSFEGELAKSVATARRALITIGEGQ